MKIDSNVNLKSIASNVNSLPGGINRAVAATLNRVSTGMKTETSRQVRKRYNIKNADVKRYGNIKVTKAKTSTLAIILSSTGQNIPLIKFNTNPKNIRAVKVLKASVKRSGRKSIPGAFVASMNGAHLGVFKRVGKTRLPVEEKYGPAVPVMMNNPEIQESLNEQAYIRMNKRLDHEINRVLGGIKLK